MGVALTYSTILTTLTCGECSIPFAIPSDMHAKALRDGRTFCCPNGHRIGYSETENQRLERELATARRRASYAETGRRAARDQADAAERSARAYKGHTTRLRNRVAAGVCPCCTRSFPNLRDHMTTKHPGYADTEVGHE
jgi:hypothetical protein